MLGITGVLFQVLNRTSCFKKGTIVVMFNPGICLTAQFSAFQGVIGSQKQNLEKCILALKLTETVCMLLIEFQDVNPEIAIVSEPFWFCI